MNEAAKQHEYDRLEETLALLEEGKRILNDLMKQMGAGNLEKLEKMRNEVDTDPHDLLLFMEQMHNTNVAFNFKDKFKRLEEIDALLKEPYFSRIDLKNKDSEETRQVYIGKFGYSEGKRSIVTDWRSKIASVYYRYRYPQTDVKYQTPEGTETKDLTLKRTFEIDDGKLIKFYNNDIQLDETEIIQEKIEGRTGGVLEDIVETIQESQLDIIESDPRQICIVQGCVGSGKSTVAIHRLSHIFFNYPSLITPERSILIAKNQILVGYLSTLFPKLGIFNIGYGTVRDMMIRLLFQEELKIEVNLDKNYDTSSFIMQDIVSLQNILDEVHEEYEQKIDDIFAKEEFLSFGGFVYDKSSSVMDNMNEVIEEMQEELSLQQESYERTTNPTRRLLNKSNIASIKKVITKLQKLRTTIKVKTLPAITKKVIGSNNDSYGYLQTILYLLIMNSLVGFEKFRKFEYCVIDEGQDFSALEYLLLGKLVINGRFCILGDLNQSYAKDGLTSWNTIAEVITDAKNAVTFELDTNYRSTKPIIDLANTILAPYTHKYLPNSINRIGNDPIIIETETTDDLIRSFKEQLTKDLGELDKSIGVICMNKEIYSRAKKILNTSNIEKDKYIELDSSKRIHYIPQGVYLTEFENCKGLEFSKIYVLGLSLGEVSSFEEAKKAFVAVTRAMNEVTLIC